MDPEPQKSKRFKYKRVIIILISIIALIFLAQPMLMSTCDGHRLFAKSPCVKGRAMRSRVQGVMRARMNIRN